MKNWRVSLVCVLAVSVAAFVMQEDQPQETSDAGASESSQAIPQPALTYNQREGRALFRHYCLTCHGAEGHGDGLNAYNLDPKPRDLADPAFQQDRTDDDLMAIIGSGGAIGGLSPGMPPWGRTLTERQIHNLVIYIRLLANASAGDAPS